ncbi:hypothetical protein GCM10028784_28150 [Myceligenerans cantabricum]
MSGSARAAIRCFERRSGADAGEMYRQLVLWYQVSRRPRLGQRDTPDCSACEEREPIYVRDCAEALPHGLPHSTASSGAATVTPPASFFTAGSHYVKVQAVDDAGRQSKTAATYRFNVRFSSVDGYWHLDDGAGTSAADSSGLGNDLALGSGASWIEGPVSSVLFGRDPGTDWALDFDGASSANAQSAGPVVHMDQPLAERESFRGFAVSAFVRANSAASANQVAVSQDAQYTSSFKLGRLAAVGDRDLDREDLPPPSAATSSGTHDTYRVRDPLR